jgi:hypothetical protein
MPARLFHYTDTRGFDGIRSARAWRFLVSKPPSEHPKGAYFTDLDESTPFLAMKLRIPRTKIEYVFVFSEDGGLKPLPGGRGQYIFYSEMDYVVDEPRQIRHGLRLQ